MNSCYTRIYAHLQAPPDAANPARQQQEQQILPNLISDKKAGSFRPVVCEMLCNGQKLRSGGERKGHQESERGRSSER